MAHKKAGGSTKNGRDSHSKRWGVKRFGGEYVLAGNILVRQRGTPMRAGENVGVGTDHTLYAKVTGHVLFRRKGPEQRMFVSVLPDASVAQNAAPAAHVAPSRAVAEAAAPEQA